MVTFLWPSFFLKTGPLKVQEHHQSSWLQIFSLPSPEEAHCFVQFIPVSNDLTFLFFSFILSCFYVIFGLPLWFVKQYSPLYVPWLMLHSFIYKLKNMFFQGKTKKKYRYFYTICLLYCIGIYIYIYAFYIFYFFNGMVCYLWWHFYSFNNQYLFS